MPKYILKPIDLGHPDWRASSIQPRCRVTAPDEELAREFANSAFILGSERRPDMTITKSPWKNPERVKVTNVDGGGLDFSYPPLVEVPDFSSSGITGSVSDTVTDTITGSISGEAWEEYPLSQYIEQAVRMLKRYGHEVNDRGEYAGSLSFDGDKVIPTPTNPNTDLGDNRPTASTAGPEIVQTAVHSTNTEELETALWGKSKWGEAKWGGEETDPIDTGIAGDDDLEDGAEFNGREDWNTETDKKYFKEDYVEEGYLEDDNEGGHIQVISGGEPVTSNGDPVTISHHKAVPIGEGDRRSNSVQTIIANRQPLILQTQTLLHFLERIEEPGVGNEGGVQPLVRDDDEELKALLRELIAELRTFNSLLLQGKPEIGNIEKASGALGDAGRNWLEKFTTSNGTRTGDLAAGVLATLLVSAGLLDLTFATMIIGGKVAGDIAKKVKKTDADE